MSGRGRTVARRPSAAPAPLAGRYVRIDGVEHRVVTAGGWALWSPEPATGFRRTSVQRRGGAGYVRPIAPDEQLECYRIRSHGTYRGIAVEVHPSTGGRVMATTRDPRAREVGFEPLERDEWVALPAADDPELRWRTTRTPEPGPWMTRPGTSSTKSD